MDNFNIDENSINKLKDMMNKGDLSDVISQIPPEMLQNFSNMMSSSGANNSNNNSNNSSNSNFTNDSTNNFSNNNGNNNFDFSKIDMNTIMKMKSIMDKMNTTNDPRTNLMNVAKIAELFNSENNTKENKSND